MIDERVSSRSRRFIESLSPEESRALMDRERQRYEAFVLGSAPQTAYDTWVSQYVSSAGRLSSAAARVALADAAPGAFLRDTGREPPSDLIARVFAALST